MMGERVRISRAALSSAVVLALLAVMVALSGLTGPVTGSASVPEASVSVRLPTLPVPTPETVTSSPWGVPGLVHPTGDVSWLRRWLVIGLYVLAFVAVLLAVVVVVRRLQRLTPSETEAAVTVPRATGGDLSGPLPEPVVAAADEGLARLSSGADVGDAVIACWVRLEEAAEGTGLPRHPSATPSEFTAGLLVAGIGHDSEVRELLSLYHRARFGAAPLPADAAGRAVACLQAIRASALERTVAR
jgi:hypothetical protein